MKKYFGGVLAVFVLGGIFFVLKSQIVPGKLTLVTEPALPTETPEPTSTPTLTPTPTPRPLTLAEMNERWGPCARVPVLFYHHIQNLEEAKTKNQQNLTVGPDFFKKHLEYLQTHSYTAISANDLINFFDSGVPLPEKPVMITFDDGYADFATEALPLLQQIGAKTTLFLVAGLTQNPDYLSWEQIAAFPSGLVLVGNHTWAHGHAKNSLEKVTQEITLADTQLSERGLNSPKVFSYPVGLTSENASNVLKNLGYSLAFTTNGGSILCEGQRLVLPRIRIGNASLANYGL